MRHPNKNDVRQTIKTLISWQHEMRQRKTADRHALKVLELRISHLTMRRRKGDASPETQNEIDSAIRAAQYLGY